MNDVTYKNDDYQFIARVSALIFNKDESKILLFNVEGRDVHLLPGGKIHELEDSLSAIKREIDEELGWNNLDFSFLGLQEGFVNDKGYNNHQLMIMYKAIYNEDILEKEFKGLEGDWINFKWINVNEINKYKTFPSNIHDIIDDSNRIYHYIEKL